MHLLKQSTSATVKVGPFTDAAGAALTSLTIQKADVRLSKNGGDMAAASADQGASDAGAPHDELGYYDVSFNATDTATLGRCKAMISKSGALPVWQEFMVLSPRAFARQVEGATFNAHGGRVWYITASGGSASNPGTLSAPLDTFANAHSAASAGDSIIALTAGGEFTTGWVVSKRLYISSDDASATVLRTPAGNQSILFNGTSSGSELRNLFVVQESAGKPAVKIVASAHNFLIEGCDFDGDVNIEVSNTVSVAIVNNSMAATNTTVNAEGALSLTVEGNTVGGGSAAVGVTHVAINAGDGATGTIRNNSISVQRTGDATGHTIGIVKSPGVSLVDNSVRLNLAEAGATGDAVCIAGSAARDEALSGLVFGGELVATNSGSGAAVEIDASVAGSGVTLLGTDTDSAKWLGAENIKQIEQIVADSYAVVSHEDYGNEALETLVVSAAESAGIPTDLDEEPVPTSRIFTLVQRAVGLRSEDTKTIIKGSPGNTYAVDFRNDAATNQKVFTVDSIAIASGTGGGVTFSAEADWGRDETQAKFRITGVTAGNYTVRVTVTYTNGNTARGDISLVVVE